MVLARLSGELRIALQTVFCLLASNNSANFYINLSIFPPALEIES